MRATRTAAGANLASSETTASLLADGRGALAADARGECVSSAVKKAIRPLGRLVRQDADKRAAAVTAKILFEYDQAGRLKFFLAASALAEGRR
jgi:hypothetical protein